MNIYRFKTEQEFIEEFGEEYHNKVHQSWADDGSMDYLFGTTITEEFYNRVFFSVCGFVSIENTGPNQSNGIESWSISREMIKEEEEIKILPNKVLDNFIKDILKEE